MEKTKQVKSDFCIEATEHGLTLSRINNKKIQFLDVPEGVTYIGNPEVIDFLFSGCKKLREIHLPKSLKRIEMYAFNDLKSLEKINIPESVEFIGDRAFESCSSLKEIYIPDSVKSIGVGAFCGCENLEEIHLPAKLTELSNSLFYGCKKLDFDGLEIPESVTRYGTELFRNTNVESYYIPDTVTSVGYSAFADCPNLKSLNMANSVTELGHDLFGNSLNKGLRVSISRNIVKTDISMKYDTTLSIFRSFPELYKIEKDGITNLTLNKKLEDSRWEPEDFE